MKLEGWMALPLLTGCAAGSYTDELFHEVEVVTDSARHQTALTGFLLGGPVAELGVVSTEDGAGRRFRAYTHDGDTWTLGIDAKLRPRTAYVDVGRIGDRDRLITFEPGRLSWFDPEAGSERELVAIPSRYEPPHRDDVPHVDVTHDVNGDGRDDLVVPDLIGFWIFVQEDGGSFARPVKIGPVTDLAWVYGAGGYRFDPWGKGRVHELDYDLDGRVDLVFWNEDHFEAHVQGEDGRFSPEAETFTTEVRFDSDDLSSLVAPEGVRRRQKDHQPSGELTGRVLHSLADQNGDGIADLVVFSLEGNSLRGLRSIYEVHFGSPGPGRTDFAAEVGTAVRVEGIAFEVAQRDLGGDGQVDLIYTVIDASLFKAIGMLAGWVLSGSVPMELEFYCMEDGAYPGKANLTREIRTRPGDSGERTTYPPVLLGDVDGDGRSDLLIGRLGKELRVFTGVPGEKLFTKRPRRIKLDTTDEEHTWLVDLNADGKQDVLLHHTRSSERANGVTILLAR